MAGPAPFTAMPDTSAKQPITAETLDALTDRAEHDCDLLYIRNVHRPMKAHDHDFKNSAGVHASHVPNLLLDGHPRAGWAHHGATLTANGAKFTATGQRVAHQLFSSLVPGASVHAFGTSADLIVSFYARGTSISALAMRSALVNGDSTTVLAGPGGAVTDANITSDWQRFYWRISSFDPTGAGSVCAGFFTASTFTGTSIEVDYGVINPGHRLTVWEPGCGEQAMYSWHYLGQSTCPLYDRAMSFDNAVDLT